jgi:hypothetical protein
MICELRSEEISATGGHELKSPSSRVQREVFKTGGLIP